MNFNKRKNRVLSSFGFASASALLVVGLLLWGGLPQRSLAISPAIDEPEHIVIAKHKFHPSHLLARVGGDALVEKAEQAVENSGLRIKRKYRLVKNLWLIETRPENGSFDSMTDIEKVRRLRRKADQLIQTRLFQYVEFDNLKELFLEPNDTAYKDGILWALHNIGQNSGLEDADIDAPEAWSIDQGKPEITVAVIDTGVRYTHQDLDGQMWNNTDETAGNFVDDDADGYVDNIYGADPSDGDGDPMDTSGHGTHVSGTIAAKANDGNPHVGVAWNVRIMAVKLFPNAFTSTEIACVEFAAENGAHVANCSYGSYWFQQAEFDTYAAAGDEYGLMFSCSAGNSFNDNDGWMVAYPCSFELDNIISVAATDRSDQITWFSNYGEKSVDLGAPGTEIFSTTSDSDYSYEEMQGTSMAAPHVAGVLSLMRGLQPGWSILQIREKLLESVDPLENLDGLVATGGRLNARNAIDGMLASGAAPSDGRMFVSISPPSGSMLLANSVTNLFVNVIDGSSVTNAVVIGLTDQGGDFYFNNTGDIPDVTKEDGEYAYAFDIPNVARKMSLTLLVSAPKKIAYAKVIKYDLVPIPENDNFENGKKILKSVELHPAFNTFATLQDNEPFHAGGIDQVGSLWWNLSPSETGRVIVDTNGSDIDALIEVYSGPSLEQLVRIEHNKADWQGRRNRHVFFDAIKGKTYRIAVAGENEDERGYVHLRTEVNGNLDLNAPYVQLTSPNNGSIHNTNRIDIVGLAKDPIPNASGVKEVLISVNSPMGQTAIGVDDWHLPVFLKEGLNTINIRAKDFSGNISEPYRLEVDYQPIYIENDHFADALPLNTEQFVGNGVYGKFVLSQDTRVSGSYSVSVNGVQQVHGVDYQVIDGVNLEFLGDPPALGSKIKLDYSIYYLDANNIKATRETGEPFHAGNEGAGSAWWYYKAPEEGLLVVEVIGGTFDTVSGAYLGDRVSNLNEIMSNDDNPDRDETTDNLGYSKLRIPFMKGMVVHIAIDGFGGSRGVMQIRSEFTSKDVHKLTLKKSPQGSVEGIPLPYKQDSVKPYAYVAEGTPVTLKATPNKGMLFQGWQGDIVSLENPLVLSVTEDIFLEPVFVSGLFTDDFETGDFSRLNWKLSGDVNWRIESKGSGDNGTIVIRSGNIGDAQTSILSLNANFMEGQAEFGVRVDSEEFWDKFEFLVDGKLINTWSGYSDWEAFEFELSKGTHHLEWRYSKDFANQAGEDTVWLDDFRLPLSVSASLEVGAVINQLIIRGLAGHKYILEISNDLKNWRHHGSVVLDNEGQASVSIELPQGKGQSAYYRAVAP